MERLKNKPYYEVREARDLKQLLEDSCRIYKDRPAYYDAYACERLAAAGRAEPVSARGKVYP